MAKRKQTPNRSRPPADDLLLQALRKAADEVLEETVPDRLLELVRSARGRPATGQAPEVAAGQPPTAAAGQGPEAAVGRRPKARAKPARTPDEAG